jgi:phosphatidylinositol glycan class S
MVERPEVEQVSNPVDRSRRPILVAYWAVVFLALPIWWYTTSIERLSLPSTRVLAQAKEELRIPVDINLDVPNAAALSTEIQDQFSEWSRLDPLRWKGLQIKVHNRQQAGPCTFDQRLGNSLIFIQRFASQHHDL